MTPISPLHIALLGPAATPDFAPLGGPAFQDLPQGYVGAPFMATLAAGLLERGHRVTVISMSSDLPCDEPAGVSRRTGRLELLYVPLRKGAWRCNGWRPGHILDLFRFERRAMGAALAQVRPDVVHAHWPYEFAWSAIDSGLPHVVTCHDSPFRVARLYRGWKLGGYRRIKAWMAWRALRRATCVSAVSPYLAQEVAPLCRSAAQVVPNPVAQPAATTLPMARTPGTSARVLMVCNGWSALKNPQAGLNAFAQVARALPEVELVLLGHGFSEGGPAQRWCREAGIEGRMRFVGPASHEEVGAWMAGSDLLLHPSLEESFGMVVAEALAAGLPVVCGQGSGAVPWVVGEGGKLVDVTRPDDTAAAMLELLRDPGLRARLGEAGRSGVRARFGVSRVVEAYEELYRRALSRGAGHAAWPAGRLGAGAWS
jgi:glycosyltransferase involved in cell wall biosynthesis